MGREGAVSSYQRFFNMPGGYVNSHLFSLQPYEIIFIVEIKGVETE